MKQVRFAKHHRIFLYQFLLTNVKKKNLFAVSIAPGIALLLSALDFFLNRKTNVKAVKIHIMI